jgi:hypothetical protein
MPEGHCANLTPNELFLQKKTVNYFRLIIPVVLYFRDARRRKSGRL